MAQNYIDRYLKSKGSPLAGQGSVFMAAGRKYRVDPRLLVAIAGSESSFGKYTSGRYNPFGWGPGIDFDSWRDAIYSVAKGLRKGYLSEGRKTIPKIGEKWAPIGAGNDPTDLNSNWVKNVTAFYKELGGKAVMGAAIRGSNPSPPQAPSRPQDFSPLSQEALGNIAQYDPLAQLEELALSAKMGSFTSPGKVAAPSVRKGGKAAITPGGGWAGSKGVASSLVKGLGLSVTSEKRDTKNTSSGGVSDHWTGSKTAYAYDLGGSVRSMDKAAMQLARRLGISYRRGQPLVETIYRKGYRIQILYRTNIGGNHFNHIHVGVRKI